MFSRFVRLLQMFFFSAYNGKTEKTSHIRLQTMTNRMTKTYHITSFVEDVKADFRQNGMTAQASIDELIESIQRLCDDDDDLDTSEMLQNVLEHIVADSDNAELTIELMKAFPDLV